MKLTSLAVPSYPGASVASERDRGRSTSSAPISTAHATLMALALAAGLAIDVYVDLPGQVLLSAAVWGLLFYVVAHLQRAERQALFACLAIATAGELFLSLVWGLYTYRLGNIPLFVPPGHAMLLLLGLKLAGRMSARAADAILAAAAAYAITAALSGLDTFALPLIAAIALVAFAVPSHRPLYASTFVLALGLELYGTWLGNWTWSREVPVLALVTTNPPGVASAFYAVLDALVVCTGLVLARQAVRRKAGGRRKRSARQRACENHRTRRRAGGRATCGLDGDRQLATGAQPLDVGGRHREASVETPKHGE